MPRKKWVALTWENFMAGQSRCPYCEEISMVLPAANVKISDVECRHCQRTYLIISDELPTMSIPSTFVSYVLATNTANKTVLKPKRNGRHYVLNN